MVLFCRNRSLILGLSIAACYVNSSCRAEEAATVTYGVDVSYPMHHGVSTNYAWLPHNLDPSIPVPEEYKGMPIQPLGDMKKKHEEYIQGCVQFYNKRRGKGQRCYDVEAERIEMTLRQPQSMYNYTETGFKKIRAPDHVFKLIREFWEKNRENQTPEHWTTGNIYTNHWASPTYMVSVEDPKLEGAGYVLKQHIWNAARETIEEWTGNRLVECSLYGIRVYTEGAILAPHVDRNPLVSSAIINVDQDVDEPWPLEVIGHDGIARNVTMVPGDMVLYESHSIIHARPFPLKGRFMANVFIHFEPIGPIGGQVLVGANDGLPPYVIPGSPEDPVWRESFPNGHQIQGGTEFTTGSTEAHHYASNGEMNKLVKSLDQHAHLVNVRDENGWAPLHEAVRYGDVEIVQLLLDRGAEMNARTGNEEDGMSPLALAMDFHDEDHPIVRLLQERGAIYYRFDQQEL